MAASCCDSATPGGLGLLLLALGLQRLRLALDLGYLLVHRLLLRLGCERHRLVAGQRGLAVLAGQRRVLHQLEVRIDAGLRRGEHLGGVKRLRPTGGSLSLVCTDQNISKIFEITGLDRVFPIYKSRDEALAGAAAGGTAPA